MKTNCVTKDFRHPALKVWAVMILILFGSLFCTDLLAQTINVSGVVSASSGEALPGAYVIVKGTTIGIMTDNDGKYSLANVPSTGTLVFSFLGMKTLEINVEGRTNIDATLEDDAVFLSEEIVVIGYGTMKKKDLTGSVSSVKAEKIAEVTGTTIAQTLQGRAAGVIVQQNSGAPGATLQIRIRGNNSIRGDNEPLWVIDGFPVSNANMINTADIESIDILKDASATAIYGSRGANGVVIVTTKRGKAGKTTVTYDGSFGIQTLRKKFDMMNAEEYMTLTNIQYNNDFGIDYFTQNDFDNLEESVDWQDMIYRKAKVHDHAINITGGNDKTKFSLGGSYFDQEGIIKNSEFKRISVRNSIDHNISKYFNVSFNALLTRTSCNDKDDVGGQRGGNLQQASFAAPPTIGPYNEDGTYKRFPEEYTFVASGFVNPLAYVNETNDKWFRNRVMSNIALNIKPIDGLVIMFSGNVLNTDYRRDYYQTSKYPNSPGRALITATQVLELSSSNTITYNKAIRDHSFSIMAGSTYEYLRNTPFTMSGEGYVNDILETYDLGSAAVPGIASSSYADWKILSFLSRFNYNYKDKYLATFTVRADGSSRFSEGDKWGTFPSAALAWRVSKESFMEDIDFISNFKLRLGYGETGNPGVSAYGTLNMLTGESGVWDKTTYTGYNPGSVYPGKLKWETTTQTNAGIDIGFFDDRLNLSADYYVKNTTDLLSIVDLAMSSGYTSTVQNNGKIRNRGFEFQVDAVVCDKAFKWNLSGNISFNRNEVVELADGKDISGTYYSLAWMGDYINLIREGEPFGVFYGYMEDGYDENGKIKYKDLDGIEGITDADKTVIGNPNPDFIYSIDSKMTYKNFTLSVFFQGVQGNDIYCLSMGSTNYDYGWGMNTFREVLTDHWTPENTDAKYPIISTTNTYQVSDRFVYDGSYLRLKNIELSYSVPLEKLGINWSEKCQVYASGQNLLTITSYPWWDPDVNSRGSGTSVNQGIDHFSYPTYKSVTFGLRLAF